MRISDWSSDVCSSDLRCLSSRPLRSWLSPLVVAVVDLRPLQATRVVDVHGLDLAELLDAARAGLAEAVPGVLRPPERQRYLGAAGGRVAVGDSGVDGVDSGEGPVQVARVNGRSEEHTSAPTPTIR